MPESNNTKIPSLHLFFKTMFETVKTRQDSMIELQYTLKELKIAEFTKNEGLIFEKEGSSFSLKCVQSDKRSCNFINSVEDQSTKKRTESDQIRDILFAKFCQNNFEIIQTLSKYFLKNCTITSLTYDFIDDFCKDSFENEENKRELINFITEINDDFTKLSWVFVFLCFPQTPSEKNTDYRLLLLNKILQSGHTESKFQPLDITGNDQQIEKINSENIGRSEELEEIKKEMLANNTVLVYGIGGIGKSYICRKLFWNYYDSFSDGIEYLAWIQYNGDLIQSVTSSFYDSETNLDNIRKKYEGHPVISDMFVKLALSDKPDDKMQVIKEYFSKLDSKLLVFIDNADTMTKEEKKWLNSCKCRMIITSRQKIDGFYGVNINSPSPAYCKEMYIRDSRGNNWDGYSLDEEKYINKITELANYHTQTVMLIAKAQYCLGLSSEEMLEELNATGFVLQGYDDIIDTEDYELTMAEHLTKIFNLLNVTDETQLKTIRLFSLLAPNTPIKKRDIKKWFELKSLSSINELVKYGWLNSSGSEYVSIHPVIACVVKYNYKPDFDFALPMIIILQNELKNEKWQEVEGPINIFEINLILNCIYIANIFEDKENVQYANFLLYIINAICSPSIPIDLSNRSLGEINYYHRAYSILYNSYKDGYLKNPDIYFNMASVCSGFGDYDKALDFTYKSLAIEKMNSELNNGQITKCYRCIGGMYEKLQNNDKALEYYNTALDIAEHILGVTHEETLYIYFSLFEFYYNQRNYNKAIEFCNKLFEMTKLTVDKEDWLIASFLYELGELNYKISDYETALNYLNESLFINIKIKDNDEIIRIQKLIKEIESLLSKNE